MQDRPRSLNRSADDVSEPLLSPIQISRLDAETTLDESADDSEIIGPDKLADDSDELEQSERPKARYTVAIVTVIPLVVTLWLSQQHLWPKNINLKKLDDWDEQTIKYLNYIGDASFAITGSLTAGRKGMDLLGCTILGIVTALGGGTIRDILIGRFPIGWMVAYDEFLLCVVMVFMTFFGWQRFSRYTGVTEEHDWLFFTDCIGVGCFAAVGAQIGHKQGVNIFGCAVCGMITACGGGIVRDVLCLQKPRILYSSNGREIYALPALLGGFASASLLQTQEGQILHNKLASAFLGIFVSVLGRTVAWNRQLALPNFDSYSSSGLKRNDLEEGEPAGSLLASPRSRSFASSVLNAPAHVSPHRQSMSSSVLNAYTPERKHPLARASARKSSRFAAFTA
jgi:uncharacterized membrane protein YeiH